MIRVPVPAIPILALALTMAAGGLAGTAHAMAAHDCGAGFDKCMAYCDAGMWGGPPASKPLGQCNDYCAQGTNICESGRIPRPGGRHYHSSRQK